MLDAIPFGAVNARALKLIPFFGRKVERGLVKPGNS
jgi:hypothetical protein